MTLLIIGTILFFGIHFVPSTPLKARCVEVYGANKYKLMFSLVSAVGLGLIIYGFSLTHFIPLFDPLPWGRDLVIYTMPVTVILLLASDLPNNIKRWVRHPMLLGLMMWGGTHLLANGDLASTILFSSFSLFAFLDIILVTQAGRYKEKEAVSGRWDVVVVLLGLAVYCLVFYFHGFLTGMPLM
jgi:uncharacterized membrane protein